MLIQITAFSLAVCILVLGAVFYILQTAGVFYSSDIIRMNSIEMGLYSLLLIQIMEYFPRLLFASAILLLLLKPTNIFQTIVQGLLGFSLFFYMSMSPFLGFSLGTVVGFFVAAQWIVVATWVITVIREMGKRKQTQKPPDRMA